ncbi:MAG: sugar phosphate isomerase/epimerase [Ruminococcaceae bacterium]|nr:sugar phosphate isomerase/epimerase [Oscillospiraceae bacterium]
MRLGRIQNDYTVPGFELVKAQGLSFVEICRNSEEEALDLIAKKDTVKDAIARTGIPVSCVGRWNHDVQAEGKLDAERMKSYVALLDTAIELGAKTFVCGINYDESISLYKNYVNAVEFFGTLTDRAKASGIKVAIQNCDWNNFVVTDAQWKIILGENPDLYIKYDPSHAFNRGENYLALLSDWGERVAHMHVKGGVHAGRRYVDDPPAGMDDINWPSVFAILYARGYNGDLSIEPHSATWHGKLGDAGVKFTRDYINGFILE